MRIVLLCVIASAGCLRQTEYRCSDDTSCGTGGQCETNGYCSVGDPECSSGRRYHVTAGALGGSCVEGSVMVDAAPTIDTNMVTADASFDAAPGTCPAGYAPLTGGQAGHMYKVVNANAGWMAQHNGCKLTTASAYLAIPDDANELQAMDALIGGSAVYWVGISDLDMDTVWKTVLGDTQTFLPWDPPAPDNQNPGEYCVTALAASHEFNDDRCNSNKPAICECAP
jgi:hypothetical protein